MCLVKGRKGFRAAQNGQGWPFCRLAKNSVQGSTDAIVGKLGNFGSCHFQSVQNGRYACCLLAAPLSCWQPPKPPGGSPVASTAVRFISGSREPAVDRGMSAMADHCRPIKSQCWLHVCRRASLDRPFAQRLPRLSARRAGSLNRLPDNRIPCPARQSFIYVNKRNRIRCYPARQRADGSPERSSGACRCMRRLLG